MIDYARSGRGSGAFFVLALMLIVVMLVWVTIARDGDIKYKDCQPGYEPVIEDNEIVCLREMSADD